ncbi:MAG: hypothetical protein Q4G54_03680 [Pelistega sp.]|nr:hypothetical protein [Pelistega sp.]
MDTGSALSVGTGVGLDAGAGLDTGAGFAVAGLFARAGSPIEGECCGFLSAIALFKAWAMADCTLFEED